MTKTLKLTVAQRNALLDILDMAIENSCSCNLPGAGKGFEGHGRDCWVHLHRKSIAIVRKLLEQPLAQEED